jgi:molecular chaperone DnaK (HSP70)
MSRYLIGIDLGTTNSAIAFVDLTKRPAGTVEHFPVPQLIAPGEVADRSLLPSFLYLPGEHDMPAGAAALPWDAAARDVIGEFARNAGSRIPGRLVTSAKSWLCHAGIDRSAPLLPWSAPPEVSRISPVEASTRYLKHMVAAWNSKHPGDPLEKQKIVLTVPASFDDVARQLTVEAARKAGIEHLTLLEEPQAAFYCWLATHSAQDVAPLRPGDVCLVVDVGGGTTDFSLIQASEEHGEFGFLRQAVGDHLLLGGDNMDLALAKFVEGKLPAAGKLDAVQYGMLTQACRAAKEALLAAHPPEEVPVTVMGRGRSVIGGTLTTTLKRDDLREVLLDGFFPFVLPESEPQRGGRVGLHEMGLPYVSDAGITRHLVSFLRKHLGKGDMPASPRAVLFNGGVFTPESLRTRVIDAMKKWYDRPDTPWQPLVLSSPSLDWAVAWGAAYFGWLKHSGGRRIGGGIARSYYLGVGGQTQDPNHINLLCVVPRGLEEGHELTLDQPELELALGQPVQFPLFSSTVRAFDKVGDLMQAAPNQLLRMPPLHTVLRGGKRSGTKSMPVTLASRLTEIGTLELFCVAKDGQNRWRLEFNTRDVIQDDEPDAKSEGAVADVWPEELVAAAGQLIRETYKPGSTLDPRNLTKSLEASLEAGRDKWPTGVCRRLWDFLAEVSDHRRLSPGHLSRWFNLVGFCLRPGFGDPMDRFRVEQLWKLLHAPKKDSKTIGPPEGGADYWIMWRRVAAGLNTSLQNTLFNRLRPVLLPSKNRPFAKPPANEWTEMWRAAASLERLDLKTKEALGDAALKSIKRPPAPPHAFFSLTRLGARIPLYGPLNSVIHPQQIERWLAEFSSFIPAHDSDRLAWLFCLAQLARKSGQRAIDVADDSRDRVLDLLRSHNAPPHWIEMVDHVSELEADEQRQLFGESLPIGLRLVKPAE